MKVKVYIEGWGWAEAIPAERCNNSVFVSGEIDHAFEQMEDELKTARREVARLEREVARLEQENV